MKLLSSDRYLYFGSIAAEFVLKFVAVTWLVGKILEMAIWRNDRDPSTEAYNAHADKLYDILWFSTIACMPTLIGMLCVGVAIVSGFSKLSTGRVVSKFERWTLSHLIDVLVLLQAFVYYILFKEWVRYLDVLLYSTDKKEIERSLSSFEGSVFYIAAALPMMGLPILGVFLLAIGLLHEFTKKSPAAISKQ